MNRAGRIAALKAAARERILILDGSWGVFIQSKGLTEDDFRGQRFATHNHPLRGDYDVLCLTRPDIVTEVHDAYFAVGADIGETNNLAAAKPELASTLAKQLADYLSEVGAEMPKPNPNFDPAKEPAMKGGGKGGKGGKKGGKK